MTTLTYAAPTAPAAGQQTLRVTQPRVLLSEWTRFRSLRSTMWTLLTAVVLTIGIGALHRQTSSRLRKLTPYWRLIGSGWLPVGRGQSRTKRQSPSCSAAAREDRMVPGARASAPPLHGGSVLRVGRYRIMYVVEDELITIERVDRTV